MRVWAWASPWARLRSQLVPCFCERTREDKVNSMKVRARGHVQMVRAVVSARQASLERSGFAPAPCPQAEPRPDAEERRRETQRNAGGTCAGGTCPGHVCKVARGRGGGRVHASDRRQTCVCLAWAQGAPCLPRSLTRSSRWSGFLVAEH